MVRSPTCGWWGAHQCLAVASMSPRCDVSGSSQSSQRWHGALAQPWGLCLPSPPSGCLTVAAQWDATWHARPVCSRWRGRDLLHRDRWWFFLTPCAEAFVDSAAACVWSVLKAGKTTACRNEAANCSFESWLGEFPSCCGMEAVQVRQLCFLPLQCFVSPTLCD